MVSGTEIAVLHEHLAGLDAGVGEPAAERPVPVVARVGAEERAAGLLFHERVGARLVAAAVAEAAVQRPGVALGRREDVVEVALEPVVVRRQRLARARELIAVHAGVRGLEVVEPLEAGRVLGAADPRRPAVALLVGGDQLLEVGRREVAPQPLLRIRGQLGADRLQVGAVAQGACARSRAGRTPCGRSARPRRARRCWRKSRCRRSPDAATAPSPSP